MVLKTSSGTKDFTTFCCNIILELIIFSLIIEVKLKVETKIELKMKV
jgi:hypothetical protein